MSSKWLVEDYYVLAVGTKDTVHYHREVPSHGVTHFQNLFPAQKYVQMGAMWKTLQIVYTYRTNIAFQAVQ
jgi:hypothetical protein